MKKLTMSALGLSLMIGSAFAAVPPQGITSKAKPAVKKSAARKNVKPVAHALTSASNPKPVTVK